MIVAATALIVALAGTAMAAPTAIKSILNKQEKKQVKNIAKNQVNKLAPGLSVANAKNADAAKCSDTAANADAVGGQSLANITIGRSDPSTGGPCDPNSTAFVSCASVDVNLPHEGRVLLVGTGAQYAFSTGVTQGDCRMTADGAALGGSFVSLGNQTDPSPGVTGAANRIYGNGFTTTVVTSPIGAGPHSFGLECNQNDADVEFENTQISAAVLGSG
jgi:hypothetical protein